MGFTACDLPLAGQHWEIPPGRYDWVCLLLEGAPRTGWEETVWLHYRGGADPEFLRPLPEESADRPGTVLARIGVARRDDLTALVLPVLADARVVAFALLESSVDVRRAEGVA
ncbi:hypothetical protein [Amycolatopsis alba]|uniref:Uncharacterized protein n=1 Tax=Amycolatopsis alba DSM 44262 TaxID=1125972 RepID=A0A229REC8_AMYAL|nr:hypothetical protein [Amycolatopsis alba]OXM45010.1 hypothetical protein CFP75_32355 [Amycolatopsis alba DSM 44262]